MVEGEDKNKKDESKGFAGLSSLVSDVDTSPPPAPKKEPAAAAPSAGHAASQAVRPQPPASQQRPTYQEPAQPPPGGSSGGKWVLGIAVVIGVLWLIGQSNTTTTTSSAPAYSPPVGTSASSYSPPAPAPSLPQPQAPSRPTESRPPVGQDLVFSMEQIRYCLAEDIRMDGTKSALNNYSDQEVNRFNAMVTDYNSRCGSFRYRRGALESARSDIAPWRSEIYAEGQNRLAVGVSGSKAASSEAVEPTGSHVIATAPQQVSTSTQQQNEAPAKVAAQSEWKSAISNWAKFHSDFLADSHRMQRMQDALDAINLETGGSLSNKELINAAYRRAAIETGWLTEIPSTAEGKPISKSDPISPRGTQVEQNRAKGKATCVYKPTMSSDDLHACGIDPAARGG
ncbi:hypothetical protein [Rhodanobacter sp. UC4451_H18]